MKCMRTGFRDESARNILMRSCEELLNFSRRGKRGESEKSGDHQRELPGGWEEEVKNAQCARAGGRDRRSDGLRRSARRQSADAERDRTAKTRGASDSCSVGGAAAVNNSPRDRCCRKREVRAHRDAMIGFNPRRRQGVKATLHGRSERHCNRRRRVSLSMDSGPQS